MTAPAFVTIKLVALIRLVKPAPEKLMPLPMIPASVKPLAKVPAV